jgi:hypothetical protein
MRAVHRMLFRPELRVNRLTEELQIRGQLAVKRKNKTSITPYIIIIISGN